MKGLFLKANGILCRILGYPEEELLTKTFQDLTHPDDLADDLDYVDQLMAGRISEYEMEKRYIHKQGHLIEVQLNVSLVKNDKGEPLFFVSQIQDISRRKKAERALNQSRERFEMVTRQLNDVAWAASADGSEVLEVNPAFEKVYGWPVHALKSNPKLWADMVHPDDRDIALASHETLLKTGKVQAEYRIVRPAGRRCGP